MPDIVRCRFDHTAAGPAGGFELVRPVGQLEARHLSDVTAVVAEAESEARRGRYAAGFIAYDAAPAFDAALTVRCPEEPRPSHPSADDPVLPLAWFGLFAESCPARDLSAPPAGPAPGGRTAPAGSAATGPDPVPRSGTPPWTGELDESGHRAAIEAARQAIADGDTYLVNLTGRFRRTWAERDDPLALYQQLVAAHPVGYHGFIETTDWAVACGSPELFFELEEDRLTTRPMKGTARRGRWPAEDSRRSEALRTSPKERAENLMVVDLLRNDLGRIAVPGTVSVPSLWEVERHPGLWQLTSTVTAAPVEGVGVPQVVAALFPSGSVTGAPKVSTMGLITALESSPRGVYCGAVGLMAPAGGGPGPGAATSPARRSGAATARFAVAIRTAVVDKAHGCATYGSGGGITSDSDPAAEWDELAAKAGTLFRPPPGPAAGVGLLETVRFDPGPGGGTVRNLGAHLDRLAASADFLGRSVPTGIDRLVAEAVAGLAVTARVRIVVDGAGTVDVSVTPLVDDASGPGPLQLCVDPEPVCSSDAILFHKTTDRRPYDTRSRRHVGADDVVLRNERGEATETTRASLAVRMSGRWRTPPLDCGLLPGVERARLLADGTLVEQVVTVDELLAAEAVATLSSLRGMRPAVVTPCTCHPA